MSVNPCFPRAPASAISKTLASASSSKVPAERPAGLYAESEISDPIRASLRMTDLSRTISAYRRIFAADGVFWAITPT